MAHRVTGMKTNTPKGRRPGRSPDAAPKTTARTVAPKKAATPKRPMAPSGGFTSKEALRAQIYKLERANATLRTKSREASRAAKIATDRIAELEEEVARLQKRVASQAAAAKRRANRLWPPRASRRTTELIQAMPFRQVLLWRSQFRPIGRPSRRGKTLKSILAARRR